mmetsp:Transcript_9474/g.20986  ORF Transcript_9474/g.20986 Transcript_9474/m.20986 type:complete len:258 (-) Transcript_9474:613-1386(-)
MRVRALPGESVVHPLGKEAAMDRHPTTVEVGNFPQARLEGLAQSTRRHHCVRRHVGNHLQDPGRLGHGSLQFTLQLAHEIFTLISAANGIQTRSFQTVGSGHHVVGHYDLRLLRIRVIQRTQSSQVVSLLRESPVTIERLFVEGREAHASGLLAFHVLHGGLQGTTFPVVEAEIPLADLLHQVEVGLEGWGRNALVVFLFQLAKPIVSILPIGIPPGEDGLLGVDLLGRGGREVPSQEEADVPGAHHVIRFDACHLP